MARRESELAGSVQSHPEPRTRDGPKTEDPGQRTCKDRMPSALTAIPVLSDRDLATITRLVYAKSGISLHSGKRALVTARLQKLLKRSGFSTFKEYLRHLQNDRSGLELTAMLDAIATNHTAFFREPQHFDFLA